MKIDIEANLNNAYADITKLCGRKYGKNCKAIFDTIIAHCELREECHR